MTDDENTTQSGTTADSTDTPGSGTDDTGGSGAQPADSQPACSACGQPLHVLRGGLQVGSDGASVVNVGVWGCANSQCSLMGQDQARTQGAVNLFAG